MLYSYITKNLIGLQDVILKNVEQNKTSIYRWKNGYKVKKSNLKIITTVPTRR